MVLNGFSLSLSLSLVQPGQLLGIHEGGGGREQEEVRREDCVVGATVGQIMLFSGLSLVLNKEGL